MKNVTEILLEEPRLFNLLDMVSRAKKVFNNYELETFWYRVIKPEFSMYVGFNAEKEDLRDCHTYDTMYQYFIKLMEI